jgi:hypothetical protein
LITDIRRLSDDEQETIYRVAYALIFRALPAHHAAAKKKK